MELSYFGSDFVSSSIDTELVEYLRYKLQRFGISLYGPVNIFWDNKFVVTNLSVSTSMMNNCHNAICYHFVQES